MNQFVKIMLELYILDFMEHIGIQFPEKWHAMLEDFSYSLTSCVIRLFAKTQTGVMLHNFFSFFGSYT